MTVEAHVEEERACGVNLGGRRAGGVDLDEGDGQCSVEAHAEERSARRRHGGNRCGIEADTEEERSMRQRHGGGWYGVEADAEDEWVPAGVWQGNEL
jgi:hypothetical protein